VAELRLGEKGCKSDAPQVLGEGHRALSQY
jgi:hypothetical protein